MWANTQTMTLLFGWLRLTGATLIIWLVTESVQSGVVLDHKLYGESFAVLVYLAIILRRRFRGKRTLLSIMAWAFARIRHRAWSTRAKSRPDRQRRHLQDGHTAYLGICPNFYRQTVGPTVVFVCSVASFAAKATTGIWQKYKWAINCEFAFATASSPDPTTACRQWLQRD